MRKTNSNLAIKILNKSGHVYHQVTPELAASFVKQHRCSWVDQNTLQLDIDYQDEKRMRNEVLEESGYTCYICDKQMHKDHPDITVDHVIPKRHGGSLLKTNMICCCKKCNEEKGCRAPYTYTIHLLAQIYALVLWYNLPVSRRVGERRVNSHVSGMWRRKSSRQKEEKEGFPQGTSTTKQSKTRAYP